MDWSNQDIALEAVYQAVHYVDYRQTRVIAENPYTFYEQNPLLGEHPSTSRVRNYFIGTAIGHAVITALLPPGKYRTWWQGVTIGVAIGFVSHNHYSVNIRF